MDWTLIFVDHFTVAVSIAVVASAGIVLLFYRPVSRGGAPPGPCGLPWLGYLPFFIGRRPEEVFVRLAKKYGSVYMLKMGPTPMLILNDYKAINEAFVEKGDIFVGKHRGFNTFNYMCYNKGLIVENGREWKEQRDFVLESLKEAREKLEEKTQQEAQVMIEEINTQNGNPYDALKLLNCGSANVICSLTFGRRYAYDDPLFVQLMDIFVKEAGRLDSFAALDVFPALRLLPKSWSGLAEVERIRKLLHDFTQERIDEHVETFDEDNVRDYLDAFYKRVLENELMGSEDEETTFDFQRLRVNLLTLFAVGTTTTSSTIYWIIKLLVMHPEVQKKLQIEIAKTIGSDRYPSYSTDRQSMVYTEATIMEVQRFCDLVPFGLPHVTLAPATISGYFIPQDTMVIQNFHSVHRSKEIWGDPENFRPERFVGEDGKLARSEYLIPFSIGKRNCLGETLAKMEMFIILTSLLQKFNFRSPDGVEQKIQIRPVGARELVNYKTCFVKRD